MPTTIPAVDDDRPVDTKRMAEILTNNGYPIAPSTLNKRRVLGGGPPYRKFGRSVRYRPSKALAWAAAGAQELTSTSDEQPKAAAV